MFAISVRLAGLADLAVLAPLFDAYRQFYQQPADLPAAQAYLQARLQQQQAVVLLAQDGHHRHIGFCLMYPGFCSVIAAPVLLLSDLFVTPEARRTGAGRALLQAAEQHARSAGFARMDLTTAKTNLRAQTLYRSLGWCKDEVFDAYNKLL